MRISLPNENMDFVDIIINSKGECATSPDMKRSTLRSLHDAVDKAILNIDAIEEEHGDIPELYAIFHHLCAYRRIITYVLHNRG